MRKIFLFVAIFFATTFAWGADVYTSNLDNTTLTGATVTVSNCALATAPTWGSGFTNAFLTSSSNGYATIEFDPALDLSSYDNVELTVQWGSASNRPLNVSFNGGSNVSISGNLPNADKSKVVSSSCAISVSTLNSLKLVSSGGSGVYFFAISITGTSDVAVSTKTVCLNPDVSNWKLGNERYAVYCFGDGDEWYDMTLVSDGCGGKTYYKADVDPKYTTYIFCRMNGGTTENNWDNKWNQTNDLAKADGTYCTITSAGGGTTKAGCNWNHTPFEICISGPEYAFADDPLVLKATCPGATYFQWYKGGTAESNKIEGATSAIYRKGNCVFEDAGTYYCKAGGNESSASTSSGKDVKMFRMYFNVGRDGTPYELGPVDLHNTDPDQKKASGMIFLGENYDYAFSITDGFGHWYGNNNTNTTAMWSGNCTNWSMPLGAPQCWLRSDNGATYTFTLDYSNLSDLRISAAYPPDNQGAGLMIYFDNSVVNWTNLHYRVGKLNQTTKAELSKVPGTANLYQYKTQEYPDLNAWHIADNCGWSGDGDNRSIYRTVTGDEYAITKSVKYEGGATTRDITITPRDEHSTGSDSYNNNCEFYPYSMSPGMKKQNVEIAECTGGTVTVSYTDVDNTLQSFTSGNRDLAHTCILTVTAEPDCGQKIVSLQVNGVDFTSGDTYILSADAVIEAVFADNPAATYGITYYSDGGTINSGNVTSYTYLTGATLPTDVTKSGNWDFDGWYENSGCTGSPVTTITTTDCGNKEFWAKWVLGKPSPVFTWNGETTLKAGGIYPISVATTGDADVTLSIVETIAGVDGTFTAGKHASGTVTIGSYPAASSFTYRASSPETADFKAKTEDKTITIERCEKADIVSYAVDPIDTKTSKPRYYCEANGIGRIMKVTGNSSISTTSGTFTGETWATKYLSASEHSIQAYQEDVFKIVFYVKSTSNSTKISDLRYSDEYKESSGDWTDIKASAQIIYNDDPTATSLTKNNYETLTIIPSSPMSKNGWLYFKLTSSTQVWGAKLYHPGGDEPTSIEFSGEAEIEKYLSDAAFTITANQTTTPILSGGSITYKSSDETVATVDATTGEVTILDLGHANITATLSAFGCFAQSTASYSLTVKKCTDPICTIAVTAGKVNKCSADYVTLTATAAAGAAIQWYKDGVAIAGATNPTLTTQEAGEYYAEARQACLQVSNTITITNFAAPTATKLHEYYYIRAGRTTPDIALFQLTNVDVTDPANAFEMAPIEAPLGCAYELREDGIVYLTGTPDPSLTVDDYTITVTAKNPCSSETASANMHIYQIIKGKIAWVGCGNKGAGPANAIPASQSTDHPLYQYLSLEEHDFELVPLNAYWTTDENQIRDYYSQFDLVLLTDYPDTQVGPESNKDRKRSYSNALGCLIDEKPILSLEAFVAGCPNWGINTNPETPDPDKQKAMTLLCSGHEIFAGTHLSTDEKITVLESISGDGLQGFTGLNAPPGMLFIATIENSDNNGGTLVVCCERQEVIEARMMIMGLNSQDMGNLNADGKLIIKQIIDYLLQFKELSDCALVFDDNHGTHVWSDPENWRPTYTVLPKAFQAVRVDKPCNVDVTDAHCSSIRLRKDGEWDGKLTILPNGGLTVMDGITEVRGTNYMTTFPSAAEDLVIKAGDQPGEYGRNGSLVFGNTESDLQATVEYYSLAKDAKTEKPVWQYIGIPITDKPMAIDAYHAAWMCSWESEGTVSSNWVWVENEDRIQPFKGYCITQRTAKKYTHIGSLSRPETKDLPLYYFPSEDGPGFNMFANSWVAPIDITKIETDDFNSAAEATIFIYNAGTREQYEGYYPNPLTDLIAKDGLQTAAGQFNAIPVKAASYLDGSLTKIPTMQGFFVQATKEGVMTLDYKKLCFNTDTYSTTAETMRAPKQRTEGANAGKIVPEVMRLDVVSANWGDRVYILMHDEFSDAFDRGWDGSKQEGDAAAPMLALVREKGLLAVAAIPTAEERELSFRAGNDTEYTFGFNYDGETIYLYDRLTGEATEIKTGNTYSFTAENKTPAKRFIITKNPPRIPTAIENTYDAPHSNAEKCLIDGVLYIIKDNRFYDARGVRVNSFKRKEVTL